jgi:hypothetical protein
VIPAKIGLVGECGAGASFTAIMLALGIAKELYLHTTAPPGVMLMDAGGYAADFPAATAADAEGVPLHVIRSRSFLTMREALVTAPELGCAVLVVDQYPAVREELTDAFRQRMGLVGERLMFQHREHLAFHWLAWVRQMRASHCHVILTGRPGGDVAEDDTAARTTIGDEVDLFVEMAAIRKWNDSDTLARRGHVRHSATVLKDRRLALNGRAFLFSDLNRYRTGAYGKVFRAFAPHVVAAGTATDPRLVRGEGAPRSSVDLFEPPAAESLADQKRRRTIALEEIQAALVTIWPGQTNEEKRLKNVLVHTLFDSRSWEYIGGLAPERLEHAWSIVRELELASVDTRSETAVIDFVQQRRDVSASAPEENLHMTDVVRSRSEHP